MHPERVAPPRSKVIAAFAAVYLIWGSTYLAIRFAIETIPPFLMLAARYLVAGTFLYLWCRVRGSARPTPRQWRSGFIVGALLILVGNGMVAWSEMRVPSGVVSLLVSMTPIWMALIEWLRPGGERPKRMVIAGLLLGFLGVMLLIGPSNLSGSGDIDPVRAGVVLIGSLCWASGSLYSRRADLPANPLMATAIEMLGGALLLLATGLFTGEASGFSPSAISAASCAALIYLIIFGSLIAFTAYIWLLRASTPSNVSTYAYVNPVVAVLLGWGLAGEDLTPRMLLAAAVIVGAVIVITYRPAARGAGANEATTRTGTDSPVRVAAADDIG